MKAAPNPTCCVSLLLLRVVQEGYQAQIALFMAPTNHTLQDYLSWPATAAFDGQIQDSLRVKIFPTIDYTWGALYSRIGTNSTYSDSGSNGRMQQVRRQ